MHSHRYKKSLKNFSRELRTNQTSAEQLLWTYLRKRQLCNVRFTRQKPIGLYIVDFYAKEKHLVIELDGSQHYEHAHQIYDRKRDQYLIGLGLKVLRFNNLEIMRATESIVHIIECVIQGKEYVSTHGEFIELV